MVIPNPVGADFGGPPGYTYAVVAVRTGGDGGSDDPMADAVVPAELRRIRFTGWLAPPAAGWLVAVALPGGGTVAAGRRGIVDVGAWLATVWSGTVMAIRVLADRQLALAAWAGGEELGRYVSDPSREPGAGEDVLAEPLGARYAAAFAAACGRPGSADDLGELLAEELDPDSVSESERLARVLRLLGLPTWLVAAPELPHDVPTGPRARELTRLGAGVPGLAGRLYGRAAGVVRKRRPPPPVVADPPRGSSDIDPWLL